MAAKKFFEVPQEITVKISSRWLFSIIQFSIDGFSVHGKSSKILSYCPASFLPKVQQKIPKLFQSLDHKKDLLLAKEAPRKEQI